MSYLRQLELTSDNAETQPNGLYEKGIEVLRKYKAITKEEN